MNAMIFGVLVPLSEPKRVQRIRFRAPVRENTGRRGSTLVYEYVEYRSWEAAVKATGLSKGALRWRLERR